MNPFVRLTAIAAPIDQADINTDMLIPVRFLRKPLSAGYGNFLFFNQRFHPDGTENPDFVLNREPFRRAQILVAAANFGCGSTREGAIYAMLDFGIRVVIAPSYGPFHITNSFQNGLLPILLADNVVRHLRDQLHASPGLELTIDLPDQTVTGQDGKKYGFEIDALRKNQLLNGIDEIGITENYTKAREDFEQRQAVQMPWLYTKNLQKLVQDS